MGVFVDIASGRELGSAHLEALVGRCPPADPFGVTSSWIYFREVGSNPMRFRPNGGYRHPCWRVWQSPRGLQRAPGRSPVRQALKRVNP